MTNGNVLYRKIMEIKSPRPSLPRYFGYVHAIAGDPSYYSKGVLRSGENHCIFHYTLAGRGSCYNEFGRYDILPGQGFLSIIHDPLSGYAYPDDGTEDWEFVCFCFDGGNSIELVRDLIREFGTVYTLDKNNDTLLSLENIAHSQDPYPQSPFESSILFYDLYSDLVRSALSLEETRRIKNFNPYVQAAQTIIRDEVEQNPSIYQLSTRLGLSREYLSRLFKAETGKSIKNYIDDERIFRTCRLLKNTDMSIDEIALKMGFSSSSNFIRFFHTAMKITPADFRRNGGMPDFLTINRTQQPIR